MKRSLFLFLLLLGTSPLSAGDDCQQALVGLEMPMKLKISGNPPVARWGEVERVMTDLREALQGHACQLSFDQVFRIDKKKDVYIPLIPNLLRTVPEGSLQEVPVFNQSGDMLGTFSNRVTFEKRGEYNYTHYYFQFKDSGGKLQSSGNRFPIDTASGKPLFLVKWNDIRERVAISTR